MNNKQEFDLRSILLLSAVIIFIMFIVSSYVWTQIPDDEQVCIHWNTAGECDNYEGKFIGLYMIPFIVLGLTGLFPLLIRVEPRSRNIVQSRKAYKAIWAATLILLLAVHLILMSDLLGDDTNIVTYIPFLVGSLFMVIGNYMGKTRSNFFLGIRTPWTLSSDLSWDKTHRLGGKLFVLLGILLLVGAILFSSEIWVYLLMGSVLALSMILTAYSYFIWKNDPDVVSTE